MKLPGTLEQRLTVMKPGRFRWVNEADVVVLEDAGIRVAFALGGATSCIELRLNPDDVQFLRGGKCADFALLLARGEDEFEAHVVEHKRSVGEKEWPRIQEQLEWAIVRLHAIAGVLGIHIQNTLVYTAFCNDKLSRDRSANLVAMKIPVGSAAHRWAEARRSWESGKIRSVLFDRDVEHIPIRASVEGAASVTCLLRQRADEDDAHWQFQSVGQ